ncbi:hypothetical protein E2C01_067582 [Portunus trituberculatus]|uniref:Uncharacterized protein n=1 Tax=Portunus trituberculatus TaxID=210409 RepID=A0A5B7HU07_PORTR|nr:hypothetical protein [Portunus trituberculatus]
MAPISSKFRLGLKLVSSASGFFNIVAKFSTRLAAGALQSGPHLHISIYLIRISWSLIMRGRVRAARVLPMCRLALRDAHKNIRT